jgi:hypothetical protein
MFSFRRKASQEPGIENDSPARQFIRRMHRDAALFTGRTTVVLYVKMKWVGVPRSIGSGVPISVGPYRFIVTAAHVLDLPLAQRKNIFLSPGVLGGTLISLHDCAVRGSARSEEGDRLNDHIDLCAIRLTDEAVRLIGPEINFVSPDQFCYDDLSPLGTYLLAHGFPRGSFRVNLCRRTVRSRSFPYGTIPYRGERGEWSAEDPDVYVDLDFHPERAVDDYGKRVRTPSPRGMSGCGIWRLFDGRSPSAQWSINDVRLAAIEHRWNRDLHILRGTKIAYVNQLLAAWPECQPILDGIWRSLRLSGRL